MKIPFFDSKRIQATYIDKLQNTVLACLDKGDFIQGESVKLLEKKLEDYLQSKHCITCANGSEALTIALLTLNIPKNSEVIIPAFNYVSAAESCVNLGLIPIFCDVDKTSYNTNLDFICEKISLKTKAIIVTHLFGLGIPDIQEIADFCKSQNIYLIEDNAQSFGASVNNKKNGTFGDISTTSFFPTKNLGGAGDGGAIFTNKEELAKRARALCNHGQSQKYSFDFCAYNSRLDTIQAAFLSVKLENLEDDLRLRLKNAKQYLKELSDLESITLPLEKGNTFNQFTIQVNNREKVQKHLKEKGIASMVYYPKALNEQKAFEFFNPTELPNSKILCDRVLSLPIFPRMKSDEISYICSALKEICE